MCSGRLTRLDSLPRRRPVGDLNRCALTRVSPPGIPDDRNLCGQDEKYQVIGARLLLHRHDIAEEVDGEQSATRVLNMP